MIVDKHIKFGYGDILVGHNSANGSVTFEEMQIPLTLGQSLVRREVQEIEVVSSIEIIEDNEWDLYKLISTVNKDNRIVEYKGYTLDFTNYNEESVKVVKNHAFFAIPIVFAEEGDI